MSRSQQDDDRLQELYKSLERDWNSYIQSNPRTSKRTATKAQATTPSIVDLIMDSSPRKLITSLQGKFSPSEGWKVRTNDLAIEEIMRERSEAVASGKLKGRRLLEEFEGAMNEVGIQQEEICSACSSVLIQNGETTSWSSSSTDGESGIDHICRDENCSSLERKGIARRGGDRWMVRAGWLALVLVIFALCVISWQSFDADAGSEVLTPT